MRNVLTSPEQVTPAWLTTVLQEQEILPHGEVIRVTPGEAQPSFASAVWHITVNYSPDAPPDAPQNLFLKVSNAALSPGEYDLKHGHKEAIFYHMIAPVMNAPFTIPCYDAACDIETGASHILLKNIAETHAPGHTPSSQRNCEQAIDSLAHLHGFWWDHPRLGKDIGEFPSQAKRQQAWSDTVESTTAFMTALGDQLSSSWRETYKRVLAALPVLFQRHATGRNLTLVHGDAHLGNFLFPQDANSGRAYMVDWQFWHPTIGGTDLAFMMATEWEIETRRRLEQGLLRRYYDRLLTHGVQGYTWEDCWNDYRLSVMLVSIFIPVWRWAIFKWAPDVPTLDKSMTAFEDLKCSDLLPE